jgi:hypothetical protein
MTVEKRWLVFFEMLNECVVEADNERDAIDRARILTHAVGDMKAIRLDALTDGWIKNR